MLAASVLTGFQLPDAQFTPSSSLLVQRLAGTAAENVSDLFGETPIRPRQRRRRSRRRNSKKSCLANFDLAYEMRLLGINGFDRWSNQVWAALGCTVPEVDAVWELRSMEGRKVSFGGTEVVPVESWRDETKEMAADFKQGECDGCGDRLPFENRAPPGARCLKKLDKVTYFCITCVQEGRHRMPPKLAEETEDDESALVQPQYAPSGPPPPPMAVQQLAVLRALSAQGEPPQQCQCQQQQPPTNGTTIVSNTDAAVEARSTPLPSILRRPRGLQPLVIDTNAQPAAQPEERTLQRANSVSGASSVSGLTFLSPTAQVTPVSQVTPRAAAPTQVSPQFAAQQQQPGTPQLQAAVGGPVLLGRTMMPFAGRAADGKVSSHWQPPKHGEAHSWAVTNM